MPHSSALHVCVGESQEPGVKHTQGPHTWRSACSGGSGALTVSRMRGGVARAVGGNSGLGRALLTCGRQERRVSGSDAAELRL